MSRLETYSYSPLARSDSIRLLLLQPGLPGSDVHCSLIHTTLPECHDDIYQHYAALSYVWGDAKKIRTVFVHEKPLQVTINLAAALDDLRHEEIVLRLWADAICIDQSNVNERNHQVGLMRDIYSLAQHTIIHLGESNDECDKVLIAAGEGSLEPTFRNIAANEILSRPWFTRVWVYQELVLSKDPWIQCGRNRVRWKSLHEVLSGKESSGYGGVDEHDDSIKMTTAFEDKERGVKRYEASDGAERMRLFSDMHAALNDHPREPPSLLSVLVSRRGSGVSDLRDLVYGHLAVAGLPSRANSPPCPVVDYEKSVVEVFTDATVHMAMEAKTHEVLLHNDSYNPDRRLAGLPSWVPDWSLPSNDNLALPPQADPSYHCSDPNHLLLRPEFPEPNLYSLRCVKVGTIESVFFHDANHFLQNIATRPTQSLLVSLDHRRSDDLYLLLTSYYREAYGQIQRVIGEDLLPPLPESDGVLSRQFEYRRIWIYIASSVDSGHDALIPTMMKQAFNPVPGTWIAGRKFARLCEGGFAIVPPATRSGDEIYAFAQRSSKYYRTHMLILRPYPTIPGAVFIDLDGIMEPVLIDEEHFIMVGLAWIGDGREALVEAFELSSYPGDLGRTTHAIIH